MMSNLPGTSIPKILICDDEHLECEALQHIFAKSPSQVEIVGVVHNGSDAVRQVIELSPNIIFLDIRMPGVSGLDAARQILDHAPESQIIILSAFGDFSYAQEALRLGVLDYVLKPAEPQMLYTALKKAIDRVQSNETRREQLAFLESRLAEILPVLPDIEDSVQDPVNQSIHYIRSHYQEEISLNEVALAVSLSPAYFSRLFLKRTGSGFREYIIWLRIQAAKFFLMESKFSIAEIAAAIGYRDSNHFSVVFKKKVGITPNQFRRSEGGR